MVSQVLGKRLLQFLLVFFGITLITFAILHLSPKNPAELWLIGPGGQAGMVSEEALAAQEKAMGLDQPFLVQYGRWLLGAIQGDLGLSFQSKEPVSALLLRHMGPTLWMTGCAFLGTLLLAVPLGMLCAVRPGGVMDRLLQGLGFFAISLPSFVVALFLLWLVCMKLRLLPVIASGSWQGLLLPTLVLIFQSALKLIRQVKAIVRTQLQSPYVEGARMRGVPEKTILFSHVLKNSAPAICTCLSFYLGAFLSGSAVIENVFTIQGLGTLGVSAIAQMDYHLIQGFVLWCAMIFFLLNALVDCLALCIDPRLRQGVGKGGTWE